MGRYSKYNSITREVHKNYYKGKNPNQVVGLNWGKPFYVDIGKLDIKSVCDVGCGNGQFLNDLSEWEGVEYENLYGIDLITVSQNMVIKNPKIKYFSGPANKIPIGDKSVDLLTSFDCLEHLHPEEVENTLKEFSRVTKRYFMFTITHKESLESYRGKNLHSCVEQFDWWVEKISQYATLRKVLHKKIYKGKNPMRSQSIWRVDE